ncbi:MAG: PDZ domain-containing protein, partial [Planctomycetota bacterium]|nr:PDZ domain-containing protein [Planctomycetota bacterium]
MSRRQFLALIVPLLLVMVGFLALFWMERRGHADASPWDTEFFARVRQKMANEFVWGAPRGQEGWSHYFDAVNAWLGGIDPYARVTPPWLVAVSQERSSGRYGGIGIRPGPTPDNVVPDSLEIVGVKPDGPAAEAGVQVGDKIVAVDGNTVADLWSSSDDGAAAVADKIRGEPGTRVELRLLRANGTQKSLLVERRRIDK